MPAIASKHTPIDIEQILEHQWDAAGNDPEKDYRALPVRRVVLPEQTQRIADYLTTQIQFYSPGGDGTMRENTDWQMWGNYIEARRIVEDGNAPNN